MEQEENKKKKGEYLPWWAVVIVDTICLGAALCIFALFDHVIQFETPDVDPVFLETEGPTERPTETFTGDVTDPTEEPTEDPGQFGAKFADKFAAKGVIEKTDTTYKSHDVYIEISHGRAYDSNYHVMDIYIRNVDNIKTAFSSDKFNGQREDALDIAERVNAIAAINGDYYRYSIKTTKATLRNGGIYYYDDSHIYNPLNDVLVLYRDGSMKDFSYVRASRKVPTFDMETEQANGALQSWSFGPTLLRNGEIPSSWYTRVGPSNPRTAIGYYEPGHYCFVTVDGRVRGDNPSHGMTIEELAQTMKALGCKIAYNLDGGATSHMVYDEQLVNVLPDGDTERDMSDLIYIVETEK